MSALLEQVLAPGPQLAAARPLLQVQGLSLEYATPGRIVRATHRVFAGLAMVILIGLVVESLVFNTLERLTIRRWGMQR